MAVARETPKRAPSYELGAEASSSVRAATARRQASWSVAPTPSDAADAGSDADTVSTGSGIFQSISKKPTMHRLGMTRIKSQKVQNCLSCLWKPEPDDRSWLCERLHNMLDSSLFGIFLILVIAMNIWIMILQANGSHSDDPGLWFLSGPDRDALLESVNMVCLFIYVLEIVMRIGVERCSFFRSGYNCIDFIIVIAGLVDVVVTSRGWVNLQGLRAFRVLRVGRALRLISLVPQLYLLIRGLPRALTAMFWGIVLALLIILIFSIAAVELIHEPNQKIADENDTFCFEAFTTVQHAVMFFWITSVEGDAWGDCLIPLIIEDWYLWLFFAGVSMTLQLAILNVVLSVIVADSQSALEDDREHRAKQVEDKKKSSLKSLKAMLKTMDKNHDKQIAWNEFEEAWQRQPKFRSLMTILDIGEDRLQEVFDMMDADHSETVNREEFVRFVQETHFSDMRMQITTMKMDLDHKWRLLTDLHDSVAELVKEQRHTRHSIHSARTSICSAQEMGDELPDGVNSAAELRRGSRRSSAAGDCRAAEQQAGVCSAAELRSILSAALGAALGGLEARLAGRLEQLEVALAPHVVARQVAPQEGGTGGFGLAEEASEKSCSGLLGAGPRGAVSGCPQQLPACPGAALGQTSPAVAGLGDQASAPAPAAGAADLPARGAAEGAGRSAGSPEATEAQPPEASPAENLLRAAAGASPGVPEAPQLQEPLGSLAPSRDGPHGDPLAHGGRAPPGAWPVADAPWPRADDGEYAWHTLLRGRAAEAAQPRPAPPLPGQAWTGVRGPLALPEPGDQDRPEAWNLQAWSPSSPSALQASLASSPGTRALSAGGPWPRVPAALQASFLAAARQHAPGRAALLPPLALGPASASRVGAALQLAAGAGAGAGIPLQEVVWRMESAGIPLSAQEQQVLRSSLQHGLG